MLNEDEEITMSELMAEYEATERDHCSECTEVEELGIDACQGCCGR